MTIHNNIFLKKKPLLKSQNVSNFSRAYQTLRNSMTAKSTRACQARRKWKILQTAYVNVPLERLQMFVTTIIFKVIVTFCKLKNAIANYMQKLKMFSLQIFVRLYSNSSQILRKIDKFSSILEGTLLPQNILPLYENLDYIVELVQTQEAMNIHYKSFPTSLTIHRLLYPVLFFKSVFIRKYGLVVVIDEVKVAFPNGFVRTSKIRFP